jgi:hypothetical protein
MINMNRLGFFFLTATLLLSSFGMLTIIKPVNANPLPPPWMGWMEITIENPLNETYGLPVLVKFSAQSFPIYYLSGTQTSGYTGDFFYALDGQDMTSMGVKIENVEMIQDISQKPYKNFHNFTGQVYLSDLTPGVHNITIYWGFELNTNDILYNVAWSRSSQFSVDSSVNSDSTSNFYNLALPLIAASILIAALTTCILFFLKKQKKNDAKQPPS